MQSLLDKFKLLRCYLINQKQLIIWAAVIKSLFISSLSSPSWRSQRFFSFPFQAHLTYSFSLNHNRQVFHSLAEKLSRVVHYSSFWVYTLIPLQLNTRCYFILLPPPPPLLLLLLLPIFFFHFLFSFSFLLLLIYLSFFSVWSKWLSIPDDIHCNLPYLSNFLRLWIISGRVNLS